MGRRCRRLRCTACNRLFWEKFEAMYPDELAEFAQTTTCPHCESQDWHVTRETKFAGAQLGYRARSGWKCKDCYTTFYKNVSQLTPEELTDLAQSLVCPECESHDDCYLTDQVKKHAGRP